MKKLIIPIILCNITLCASATTFTVDDDKIADFNSIQLAIDTVIDGDIIVVQSGHYDENINFLGKNITVTSVNPSDFNTIKSTSIGQNDNNEITITFLGTENSNCTLSGFNINGKIEGCDRLLNPSGEIHTQATISNYLFQGNKSNGPSISRCDGTIKNCLIVDNINKGSIVTAIYPCIHFCHGELINCVIVGNYCASAIEVGLDGTLSIENSIIHNNYADHQIFVGCPATINILYSILQDKNNSILMLGEGCTLNWGPGNMEEDPCFVQEGYWEHNNPNWLFHEGDYHLKPESLCINAGNPNYIPEPNETDLDGNPRISEGQIDMGCYEFQAPECIDVRLFMIPRALNPKARRRMCFAMMIMPDGITASDFDRTEKLTLYPAELESRCQFAFDINRRHYKRTYVLGIFNRKQLCQLLGPGTSEIEILGWLKDDRCFSGEDRIKIVNSH